MSISERYFKVMGITVCLNSDFPISEKTFHSKFRLFQSDGPGNDNIHIQHRFTEPIALPEKKWMVYEEDRWKLYHHDKKWFYQYIPLSKNDVGIPVIGEFSEDHSFSRIYSPLINTAIYQNGEFGSLTLFNTDQLLFAKLLSQREGLIVHANGFKINKKGILLSGPSGAGKSTLSQLLTREGHTILCDDRMFIDYKHDRFNIYGHWNHGTTAAYTNTSAPLECIFFLFQAPENKITKISDKKIVVRLLFQSVVKHFLTRQEWDMTFDLFEKMVQQVDCYRLEFNLNGDICKQIEALLEHQAKRA